MKIIYIGYLFKQHFYYFEAVIVNTCIYNSIQNTRNFNLIKLMSWIFSSYKCHILTHREYNCFSCSV